MTTLEQALDTVAQLPIEQQEMLIEIMHNRLIEARRQEISEDAKKAFASFHQGELTPQTADQIIAELQETLKDD